MTIVIHGLGAGGAERLVSILVRAWSERGWAVTILTYDNGSAPPFYPLPGAITNRPLDLARESGGSFWRAVVNNWRRVRVLRRAVRASAPDIVLSFIDQTNVLVLLALLGAGLKVVVWENTDPLIARHNRDVTNWGRRLMRLVYPLADAIVAQTSGAADYLARHFGRKAVGIPNPVLSPPRVSPMSLGRPAVIGLGRLSPEKGFDLLVRAFARLRTRFPQWQLYIFGEGPERPRLEALVSDLGLEGCVTLPGILAEPAAALSAGDLFVLSSHIEGFSLALCEAMACGLPAVATDCSSGPREVMRNGADGLLVPPGDDEALAAAMAQLMGDADLRAKFSALGREVVRRYSLDSVMLHWDTLFERILPTPPGGSSH